MKSNFQPFKLERYFAEYEFKAPYLLSPSDCESLSLQELLDLADAQSLALWEKLSLGYTDSAGHPLLREEVTRLYETIKADDILVLTPEEGIYITMRALLDPGDEVVAIAPCYQSLAEVAKSIGCRVIEWPLIPAGNKWKISLETLPSLLTSQTKLLVINFPHNPTGTIPQGEELDRVIQIAREHGIWLFSDEMYRGLEIAPGKRIPAVADRYEKGISLCGMSKAFSLPGLRIGWLATRNKDAMDKYIIYKDYTTICNSAPSEILAIMALRQKDFILERNLGIIRTNLLEVQAFTSRHANLISWFQPDGGSIAFPKWVGPIELKEVCHDLVTDWGVMVVSGDYFNEPGPFFRIGLGRRTMPVVVQQIEKYIQNKAIG